jgi:fructose-1,6-bisphosphatase/inositol monophosphatase family enzyme
VTCIGYVRTEEGAGLICGWLRSLLLAGCHGVRETGSSVLSLCALAAGRVDAVYGGCAGEASPLPD